MRDDDKADPHKSLHDTCGVKGASIETKKTVIGKEDSALYLLDKGHRLKTAKGPGPKTKIVGIRFAKNLPQATGNLRKQLLCVAWSAKHPVRSTRTRKHYQPRGMGPIGKHLSSKEGCAIKCKTICTIYRQAT